MQTWNTQACSTAGYRYCRVAARADRHAIWRHPSQGHRLRQCAGDRRPGSGLKSGAAGALYHQILGDLQQASAISRVPIQLAYRLLHLQFGVTPFEQHMWQWCQVNAYGSQRPSVKVCCCSCSQPSISLCPSASTILANSTLQLACEHVRPTSTNVLLATNWLKRLRYT